MQQQVQETFTGESLMPFGQYKGQKLKDLPHSYLHFLHTHEKAGRIAAYIKENLLIIVDGAMKENKQRAKLKSRRR